VVASTPTAAPTGVLPGVDVVLRDGLEALNGRALGLVTNATGRARDGRSSIDVLQADAGWRLVALFSPEHGIRGEAAIGSRAMCSTRASRRSWARRQSPCATA
jgi:uncharacterized protein YbbC (DUF1343 family)